MSKKALSIIIPSRNEFPQNVFTLRSIISSLEGSGLDYEIILIDNCSNRGTYADNNTVRADIDATINKCATGGSMSKLQLGNEIETLFHAYDVMGKKDCTSAFLNNNYYVKNGVLKYVIFDDTPSHWQAKNKAMELAESDTFLFMDAHNGVEAVDIYSMWVEYIIYPNDYHGSLHLPTGHFLGDPKRKDVYKLKYNRPAGFIGYSFTPMRPDTTQVPCMVTNGMMVSREILEDIGAWPKSLGIWGGGENFLNYALAILGYKVNIYPEGVLYHYTGKAVTRPYNYNFNDFEKNKAIAMYLVGGQGWLERYVNTNLDNAKLQSEIITDVLRDCTEQRKMLESKTKIPIEEWAVKMKEQFPQYISGEFVL